MTSQAPRFLTEGIQNSPSCPPKYILYDGKCHNPEWTRPEYEKDNMGYSPICNQTAGYYLETDGKCYFRESLQNMESRYAQQLESYVQDRHQRYKEKYDQSRRNSASKGYPQFYSYDFQTRKQGSEPIDIIRYYKDTATENADIQDEYNRCIEHTCPTTKTCAPECRHYVRQMKCEDDFDDIQNKPGDQPNRPNQPANDSIWGKIKTKAINTFNKVTNDKYSNHDNRPRDMRCKHIGMANCIYDTLYIPSEGPDMIDIPTRMKSIYKSRFGEEFPAKMCKAEVKAYNDAYPKGYLIENYKKSAGYDLHPDELASRDIAIVTTEQDLANEKLTACMRGVYETREAKDTTVAADTRRAALREAVCRRSTYRTVAK